MKTSLKNTITLLLILATSLSFAAGKEKEGYSISIKVKELKEGDNCQLCYYYGNKKYIKDSAKVDKKGFATFKGDYALPEGMYLFVLPSTVYFDFMVDGPQYFTLTTDTTHFINKMEVKDSKSNTVFFNYQRYMIDHQKQAGEIRATYAKVKDNKDSTEILKDQLAALNKKVSAYQQSVINDNEDLFLSKFIKATTEVAIPEAPILENGRKDSTFAYRYFKKHYFDNFDLSDDRMLRTPFFQGFIDRYLEKLTAQHADSLSIACDELIAQTRPNYETFKYMVWWLTLHYETSKFMGMDAVFVHLVDKYYATKEADWVDSTQLAKITTTANKMKPTLIGKQAPSLNLKDSTGTYYSLYDIKSKYTVVVFWDHDCGHCKKAMPILQQEYNDTLKGLGVTIYAVETEDQVEPWKKFIKEKNLNFINVHETDAYYRAVAKQRYNIRSTPMMFLLDENKIIKAKKLEAKQIAGIVGMLNKQKEAEAKKK